MGHDCSWFSLEASLSSASQAVVIIPEDTAWVPSPTAAVSAWLCARLFRNRTMSGSCEFHAKAARMEARRDTREDASISCEMPNPLPAGSGAAADAIGPVAVAVAVAVPVAVLASNFSLLSLCLLLLLFSLADGPGKRKDDNPDFAVPGEPWSDFC